MFAVRHTALDEAKPTRAAKQSLLALLPGVEWNRRTETIWVERKGTRPK
jgi:hypothetical protein